MASGFATGMHVSGVPASFGEVLRAFSMRFRLASCQAARDKTPCRGHWGMGPRIFDPRIRLHKHLKMKAPMQKCNGPTSFRFSCTNPTDVLRRAACQGRSSEFVEGTQKTLQGLLLLDNLFPLLQVLGFVSRRWSQCYAEHLSVKSGCSELHRVLGLVHLLSGL